MAKLDLSGFEPLFGTEENFEITAAQYETMVGKALPETIRYIRFDSPLAKAAKENGYRITVEDRPSIQRTLIFNRREQ